MHYNPYGKGPVLLAVDLVNCPPTTAVDLQKRCRSDGLILDRAVSETEFTSIRAFLTRWEAVVDAVDPAARAARLNPLLAAHTAAPRLTDHAGDGWHMHFRDDDLPADRQICALIAVGTAMHLTGRGMDRLGRCAAEGCEQVYADVSRNGRQRYCSPACGNRDAVRRHRSRAALKATSTDLRAVAGRAGSCSRAHRTCCGAGDGYFGRDPRPALVSSQPENVTRREGNSGSERNGA